jgi:predicted nucleic acid-binding protein
MIVDSSALITLAGADALPLLTLSPHKAVTVSEVYRETVETGSAMAYPDAAAIGSLFQQGIVTVQDPRRKQKLAGISRTDSLVLLLAEEVAAAVLLVNDQALLRKAEQRGLVAQFTAELVQELYRAGRVSRRRRDDLFRDFVANRRYSEEFMQAFSAGR